MNQESKKFCLPDYCELYEEREIETSEGKRLVGYCSSDASESPKGPKIECTFPDSNARKEAVRRARAKARFIK